MGWVINHIRKTSEYVASEENYTDDELNIHSFIADFPSVSAQDDGNPNCFQNVRLNKKKIH